MIKLQQPRLKDSAQFVKKQAAIKNDPAFIGSIAGRSTDGRPKLDQQRGWKDNNRPKDKETLTYARRRKREMKTTIRMAIERSARNRAGENVRAAHDHMNWLSARSFKEKK